MSYSRLDRHTSMLFDDVRNGAYAAAMASAITPDSVVLDLGAGVGVLGLLAAKLGARKVYCVEPSQVATHISALARANGVGDRIEVLRGRIEDIVLPEQVDVLVSVFTGNLLFTEGLMPSLYHARDRYLKPGGAMIPDRARLLFAGAEANVLHDRDFGCFRKPAMGLDLSALVAPATNEFRLTERGEHSPVLLTETATAVELDLLVSDQAQLRWQGRLQVVRDGTLHGLLGWIELRLGAQWLSAAPDAPEVHWHPLLMPIDPPLPAQRGQDVDCTFRFIDDAQVYWSLAVEGQRRGHSRVLGNPDIAVDMMLSSPACNNPPNADAALVARVLAGMADGKSNQAIADDLLAAMPGRFAGEHEALKRVGALATHYRMHPSRRT